MKKFTRISVLIISLILGITYLLPLWKIELIAPQYPEGLNLHFWLNSISGDLQTVNNLNHYIGMKVIEPDSIAELKFMPYILALFIIFGFIVVIFNKLSLLITWFAIISLTGIAGLIDFYKWTYDYGHNLNPHAAIKLPGMSYQPPIIGTKQLLNFTATSLPGWGGIILFFTGFSIFALILMELRNKKTLNMKPMLSGSMSFLLLSSCSVKPIAIEYGKDQCMQCKMTIMDNRFGSEIVNNKGKVFKFDSIECMVNFQLEKQEELADKSFVMVTDFKNPGNFIDADKAFFLHSKQLKSPMGENLSAFVNKQDLEEIKLKFPGESLSWIKLTEKLGKLKSL